MTGELAFEQLRPTGVVVEVTRHERDVEVAGLTDGLAVVQRFEHGEQTRVLLNVPSQGVEVLRAGVRTDRAPTGKRLARRLDGPVDVALATLRNLCELAPIPRMVGREGLGSRLGEAAIDEVTEAPAAAVEPGERDVGRFRGGPVIHRFE